MNKDKKQVKSVWFKLNILDKKFILKVLSNDDFKNILAYELSDLNNNFMVDRDDLELVLDDNKTSLLDKVTVYLRVKHNFQPTKWKNAWKNVYENYVIQLVKCGVEECQFRAWMLEEKGKRQNCLLFSLPNKTLFSDLDNFIGNALQNISAFTDKKSIIH